MKAWAAKRVAELADEGLCGFVFKARSPSCGMERVEVYAGGGLPAERGVGLFARAVIERLPTLPVEDEGRLGDSELRERFIERVLAFGR
jgi:uncharacterized protein YbbK (DUF523 family)